MKPAKDTEKPKKPSFAGIIVLAIGIFGLWQLWGFLHGGTGSEEVAGACRSSDRLMAAVMAERFVAPALRSPSTASFQAARHADIAVLEDCHYRIRSFVDAQNGFGGTVRQNFTIEMRRSGDHWHASGLQFH